MKSRSLELAPEGDPRRPGFLNNAGNALQARFRCLGRVEDIDKAVALHTCVVELTSDGTVDRSSMLITLLIHSRHDMNEQRTQMTYSGHLYTPLSQSSSLQITTQRNLAFLTTSGVNYVRGSSSRRTWTIWRRRLGTLRELWSSCRKDTLIDFLGCITLVLRCRVVLRGWVM